MSATSSVLPPRYAAGFAAPAMPGEEGAYVWEYRAFIGEWKRSPVRRPPGDVPHFNEGEPRADEAGLFEELLALERDAASLVSSLSEPRVLAPGERAALARFVGLLAVRNAPHAAELPPSEARAGASSVEEALTEMGWVLWTAPPEAHFVSGSSPFHAAFPAGEVDRTGGFDLSDPSVELTFPLSPALALHATWRRSGALWRRARDEVLLEINGRTCASSRRFLLSPVPRVPG